MINGFDVALYDMNNFKLEFEKHIPFKEFLKDEYFLYSSKIGEHLFSQKGLAVVDFEFGIKDKKTLVLEIIKYLFKGYKVEYINGQYGKPDFFLSKNEEDSFYLELKFNGDGLRESQIKWFFANKNKSINKIIFIGCLLHDKKTLIQPL